MNDLATPHDVGATDLDAEVAKLMCLPEVQQGHLHYWYSPTSCGWTPESGPCIRKTDILTWVYRWGPESNDLGCRENGLREVPKYSSNMQAAWKVVEYMRELGVWFTLYDMRDDTYRASFCRAGVPMPSVDVCDKSAAKAICLAAVKVNEGWTEQ